jgi:hypothetical protein
VADPLTGPVAHPGPFGLGCAQLGNLFQAISDDDLKYYVTRSGLGDGKRTWSRPEDRAWFGRWP